MLPRDAEILDRLRQKGSRTLSFKELAKAFHVPDAEADGLQARLDALERKGEIARVRGEKYSAIEYSNFVAGRLTVRPEGFGFILADEGEDLFVPRTGMHGAMDGDTVLAREERARRRGSGGRRGPPVRDGRQGPDPVPRRWVGRFETHEVARIVLPTNPKDDATVLIRGRKDPERKRGRRGVVEAR